MEGLHKACKGIMYGPSLGNSPPAMDLGLVCESYRPRGQRSDQHVQLTVGARIVLSCSWSPCHKGRSKFCP